MRVLHVFDAAADWEQRVAVTQLLERLDANRFQQAVASVHPTVPDSDCFGGRGVSRIPLPFNLALLGAPALRRLSERRRVDVLQAWGTQAAIVAAAARPRGCALVVERFDPHLTPTDTKVLRAIAGENRIALVCSSDTVSRRFLERGVPGAACVVIRPGVDFKRINAAKQDGSIRRGLGLRQDDHLTVAAAPVDRHGGHQYVMWGGYIQSYIDPKRHVVLYGNSPEARRLRRLARKLPAPDAVRWAGNGICYEELVAVADSLVITPFGDASTTPIAWAMAASVPIIGSAVYAVAEMIAHKHNGYLILPERKQTMATKIAAALNAVGGMTKEREVARGQAYEVFGVRRFVDQHIQVYENLAADRPAGHDVTDSAIQN